MMVAFAVFLLVTSFAQFGSTKQLPSYLKVCKANDPNLSACWKKSFESMRPYMTKDLPELNLPRIDPLHMSEVKLIQNEGTRNLFLNMTLYDAEFSGIKDFDLRETYVQLEPFVFQFIIAFPQTTLKSKYKANGKILLFEFDSDGNASGTITNIVLNATWTGTTFIKKGKEHLQIAVKDIDVKIGGVRIYLDNLVKNNPEITANINDSINENADLLYDEFLPVLKKALDVIITGYSNRFYETFSMDVLYPKN